MSRLDEKTRGALAYLLTFLTGIFFILTERRSRFVRFHAWQSTLTFLSFFILSAIINILPIFGHFLAHFLNLIAFGLWLFLIWQAYQGKKYRLPYFGNLAEKQLAQEKNA